MGNPRGLPDGFKFCNCDDCCPQRKEGDELPPAPSSSTPCGKTDTTKGCYCELFYHHADGSHMHRRYLALPDANGKIVPAKGEIYDYYCVKPVLEKGEDTYIALCGDPVSHPEGGMSSNVFLTCPSTTNCTGPAKCKLYYLRGGEDGYGEKWRPVKPDAPGLDKKFSEENGKMKIDSADLKGLKTKFLFKCFCVI